MPETRDQRICRRRGHVRLCLTAERAAARITAIEADHADGRCPVCDAALLPPNPSEWDAAPTCPNGCGPRYDQLPEIALCEITEPGLRLGRSQRKPETV